MTERKAYPSDLNDTQWAEIEPLLPLRRDERGAKACHSRRELINAILYVTREGISWSALPHDFPPYKTVYDYLYKLQKRGIWQSILDSLRRKARQKAGRESEPSIVVMDSQSVKTTEKGGYEASMVTNVLKDANDK
jgi:transposase